MHFNRYLSTWFIFNVSSTVPFWFLSLLCTDWKIEIRFKVVNMLRLWRLRRVSPLFARYTMRFNTWKSSKICITKSKYRKWAKVCCNFCYQQSILFSNVFFPSSVATRIKKKYYWYKLLIKKFTIGCKTCFGLKFVHSQFWDPKLTLMLQYAGPFWISLYECVRNGGTVSSLVEFMYLLLTHII